MRARVDVSVEVAGPQSALQLRSRSDQVESGLFVPSTRSTRWLRRSPRAAWSTRGRAIRRGRCGAPWVQRRRSRSTCSARTVTARFRVVSQRSMSTWQVLAPLQHRRSSPPIRRVKLVQSRPSW